MQDNQQFANQPGLSLKQQMIQPTEESLPPEVRKFAEFANKDKSFYRGNPRMAQRRTFGQAVKGLEDGDYEGLEMLDFGALEDGTPAASFIDEDGQRQVIRLTVPQWFGGVEYRSRARAELASKYEQAAKQEAFKPYFDAILKRSPAGVDPELTAALGQMYQMDPAMAIDIAGSFMRGGKQQDQFVWRGKPVTKPFYQQVMEMEQAQYNDRTASMDRLAESMADRPYAAALVENAKSLQRRPENFMAPSDATLVDHLQSTGSGPLPLVNLFQAMSVPGMIPFLPGPVELPKPNERGIYESGQINRFLNDFNMVSQFLGWGPVVGVDETGLSAIVEALNIANRTRGSVTGMQAVPAQIPSESMQREKMRNESMERREEIKSGKKLEPKPIDVSSRDDELLAAIQAAGIDTNDIAKALEEVKRYADAIEYRKSRKFGMDGFPLDPQQQQAVLRAYELMKEIINEGQE